jgi:hypothetical protein
MRYNNSFSIKGVLFAAILCMAAGCADDKQVDNQPGVVASGDVVHPAPPTIAAPPPVGVPVPAYGPNPHPNYYYPPGGFAVPEPGGR